MDRRDFLKILGITSGTMMVSSCGVDKASEKIIPYVIPPDEDVYPGNPLFLNTTCTECPANCGMQVEINEKVYHDVRSLYPTKLEGIEGHPLNEGTLCMRGQAGLFRLYSPDRIQRTMMRHDQGNFRVATWKEALTRIEEGLNRAKQDGKKNAYFSGRTTGSLSELIDRFCRNKDIERLPEFEVFSYANIKRANEMVFRRPQIPKYHIEKADFLLTIGADIFETHISPVSHSWRFARARKNENFSWYHVEPNLSLTGVQATRRLSLRPRSEMVLLTFLLQTVLEQNERKNNPGITIVRSLPNYPLDEVSSLTGISETDLRSLATSFGNAKKPLVIAGGVSTAHQLGLEVAVLTSLLQWIMAMTDELVDFSQAESYESIGTFKDVESLNEQLDQNTMGVLFISRMDPVSMLPAVFKFSRQIKKAQLTVGLSDHMNDTVRECDVILPLSHSLESWGDSQPCRGLTNVIQPAIDPQYDTRSEGDILLQLLNNESTYKNFLFEKWNKNYGDAGTKEMLKTGYRSDPVPKVMVSFNTLAVSSFVRHMEKPNFNYGVVLCLSPSIRSYDGRSRDLKLMQEIPDPLSTISYGGWISISPLTAEYFRLKDRDEVELTAQEFSLKLPVKVQKHLSDNVVMVQRDLIPVPLTAVDHRSGEASWYVPNISLQKTGVVLPVPILSGSMEENHRGILPPDDDHGHRHDDEEHPRWYPEHEHKDYRWGMAIDLESCIGCNACTAACYVENNIPLVGLKEHLNGREMSWIRIQPYYDANDNFEFVPMMCQQCDNAPCEPVCPVYASYHNPEGLNVQVYNRCVGTRYCSNNCPYKVRRFNWFDHRLVEPLDKMYNPAISVRGRGIMEKCTFCIQRIRAAKDHAKDENRLVQDGEIIPACAQTCPTEAITFGNMKDTESRVYQLAQSERAYHALEELGTEPAVNYLGKRGNNHEA